MNHFSTNKATKIGFYATVAILGFAPWADAADSYGGKYTPCVTYSTVGESRCAPPAQAAVKPPPAAAPVPKVAAPDPVQQFLDNHGKPPREFAEFYVNPTPENAQRWVAAFRAQQQKADALAAAWGQAEQGLARAPAAVSGNVSPALTAPITPTMAPPANVTPTRPNGLRLGAFATPVQTLPQLVYYFSASCPFCARLKPALEAFTQANQSKLLFTCVDLTPLSARQAPSPNNREGLPCDWRLPSPNEVASLQVRQTPTILIRRPDGSGQRLSGIITAAQLESALFSQ